MYAIQPCDTHRFQSLNLFVLIVFELKRKLDSCSGVVVHILWKSKSKQQNQLFLEKKSQRSEGKKLTENDCENYTIAMLIHMCAKKVTCST